MQLDCGLLDKTYKKSGFREIFFWSRFHYAPLVVVILLRLLVN